MPFHRPKYEPVTQSKREHTQDCMCNEPIISPELRKAIQAHCQLDRNTYVEDYAKHVTEKSFKKYHSNVLKEMRRILIAHDTYFLQRCYDCQGHKHRYSYEECH